MPRTSLGHVAALDGVRGIAIAAVIAVHYFNVPGGFYGVDLFFVLSGFLITTLLIEEFDRRDAVSLGAFYRRRARRLLPALGVLLAAVAVAGASYPPQTLGLLIVAGGLYCANIVRLLGHADFLTGKPISHLWSLAQEEQFYFVWPPILAATLQRRPSNRAMTMALSGLACALIAYRVGLAWSGADWHRLYYGPDTHADGMVIGAVAAFARRQGVRVWAWVGPLGLIVLLMVFGVGRQTVGWSLVGLPLVEVSAAFLILAAAEPGTFGRLLAFGPLAYLGAISYSLYLWQQFSLWETEWITQHPHKWAALVIATMFTLASYYFVERPFRRRRLPPRAAGPDAFTRQDPATA